MIALEAAVKVVSGRKSERVEPSVEIQHLKRNFPFSNWKIPVCRWLLVCPPILWPRTE